MTNVIHPHVCRKPHTNQWKDLKRAFLTKKRKNMLIIQMHNELRVKVYECEVGEGV